jgi:predicted DNA-binding transcriptional regulator AlpA
MDKEILAQRLREQMAKRGAKPPEIAALCGVKRPAVYDWMKHGRIAKRHLPQLSDYFGVNLAYWLGAPEEGDNSVTEWQKEAERLISELHFVAYQLGLLEGTSDPDMAEVQRFQNRAIDARVALLAHLAGRH